MMDKDILNRAHSDIMAYQAALWRKVTGEDAADDDIRTASTIWLDDLIHSLSKEGVQPDFTSIPNHDFYQSVVAQWQEAWSNVRVTQAMIYGLKEDTAHALLQALDHH